MARKKAPRKNGETNSDLAGQICTRELVLVIDVIAVGVGAGAGAGAGKDTSGVPDVPACSAIA